MTTLFIGNFISFIGCILMVISGLIKEKKMILIVQCFQVGFLGLSNLILGAFSGFIAGIVSIARNLAFTKYEVSLKLKVFFIILQIILSINPAGMHWIDLLPIIACVSFTWYIDTDSKTLKKVSIFNLLCWAVYDFYFRNYVSLIFDLFSVISNTAGIIMINQQKTTN